MDRKRFIETAPHYYALAIAAHFKDRRGPPSPASQATIEENYFEEIDGDPDGYSYVSQSLLFNRGIAALVELGMIEIIHDDFGPDIYVPTNNFSQIWEDLAGDKRRPFYKYNLDGRRWLKSALRAVNNEFENQNLSDDDFAKPDVEWEPLPIDRNDPLLIEATKALANTVEEVRTDNGYAANFPEERQYVLDGLNRTIARLKEDAAISWAYLKRNAFEPLQVIIARFSKAALGETAAGAKEALRAWIRQHGSKALETLWNLFW